MFSSRLQWSLPPNRLSTLLAEMRQAGSEVLDLTESNPTRAGLAYPDTEILAALSDASALHYHPSPRGLETAREAVAGYYRDRGTPVLSRNILLTASTSEAYAYLFKLLANPGDEILAPRPSYPLFEFLAGLESVRIRQYPLRYDGVWHIDFDALEQAITPQYSRHRSGESEQSHGVFFEARRAGSSGFAGRGSRSGNLVRRGVPRLRLRRRG